MLTISEIEELYKEGIKKFLDTDDYTGYKNHAAHFIEFTDREHLGAKSDRFEVRYLRNKVSANCNNIDLYEFMNNI